MLTRQQWEIAHYRLNKALIDAQKAQFVEMAVVDEAVDALEHAIKMLEREPIVKDGHPTPDCKFCHEKAKARGLCRKHYHRSLYQAILDGEQIEDERLTSNGYLELRVTGAWGPLKHRVIIMQELGRLLERDEIVMFKNDDRSDCRRENLLYGKRNMIQKR